MIADQNLKRCAITAALAAIFGLSACGSGPISNASPSDAEPALSAPSHLDPGRDGGFWVNGKFHRYDRLPDKKPPRKPSTNPVKWGRL